MVRIHKTPGSVSKFSGHLLNQRSDSGGGAQCKLTSMVVTFRSYSIGIIENVGYCVKKPCCAIGTLSEMK